MCKDCNDTGYRKVWKTCSSASASLQDEVCTCQKEKQMSKHIHCEVIKAWADGAVIQVLNSINQWVTQEHPSWLNSVKYRASLAFVEGKPVFEGDELYLRNGKKIKVMNSNLCEDGFVSWNPPKPKTITITIPYPKEITSSGEWIQIRLSSYTEVKETLNNLSLSTEY